MVVWPPSVRSDDKIDDGRALPTGRVVNNGLSTQICRYSLSNARKPKTW
jgi:hypothetical protein